MSSTQRKILTQDEIRLIVAETLKGSIAKKAILFGSYARGDADEYSDIDLIVVADTERRFVQRFEDFWPLLDAAPRPMDLLVYTPAELQEMVERDNPFIT